MKYESTIIMVLLSRRDDTLLHTTRVAPTDIPTNGQKSAQRNLAHELHLRYCNTKILIKERPCISTTKKRFFSFCWEPFSIHNTLNDYYIAARSASSAIWVLTIITHIYSRWLWENVSLTATLLLPKHRTAPKFSHQYSECECSHRDRQRLRKHTQFLGHPTAFAAVYYLSTQQHAESC